MPLPNLPEVPPNPTTQQLAQVVGSLIQELSYLLGGFLSSDNARNFGGFDINRWNLKHESGIVGMSGESPQDNTAVRFWSGNADPTVAPFRVQQNGKLTATGATIESSSSAEKVVLDSNGLHSYDEFGIERVTLADTPDQSTKALYFWDSAGPAGSNLGFLTYGTAFIDGANRTGLFIVGTGGAILGSLFLSNNGIVELVTDAASPTGFRAVDGNTPEINGGGGWETIATLIDLAGKATAGASTSGVGSHDHGISAGVTLATTSDGSTVDGYVTWVPSGAHSHTQT